MSISSPLQGLRCRQISDADVAAVAALLARGFSHRGRRFWLRAFARLMRREPPPGLPKYGYLMERGGVPVGAVLVICTTMRAGAATTTRCNLSSWYVEPEFRAYASLLVSQALRHKDVTYLNVSPAPHTEPIIEAQGFARYCDGIFVAVPLLNGPFGAAGVKVFGADKEPTVAFDAAERDILLQHAAHGCISLWCATRERAYPFVFRPRLVRAVVPCVQLIYCADIADFVCFAGPIGRHLALRGRPLVIVDANGPIPGLVGIYRRGSMPKYFKGPQRPRLGDLAYTEYALLGV
jgi:hypothetical protein